MLQGKEGLCAVENSAGRELAVPVLKESSAAGKRQWRCLSLFLPFGGTAAGNARHAPHSQASYRSRHSCAKQKSSPSPYSRDKQDNSDFFLVWFRGLRGLGGSGAWNFVVLGLCWHTVKPFLYLSCLPLRTGKKAQQGTVGKSSAPPSRVCVSAPHPWTVETLCHDLPGRVLIHTRSTHRQLATTKLPTPSSYNLAC